jgi:hypothetical protein
MATNLNGFNINPLETEDELLLTSEVSMADFPKFKFSNQDVTRAGAALRGEITWDESRREELLKIFEIANNWIDSHGHPMFRLKNEAVGKVRKMKADGLTFGRLKRLRSVRQKLVALPTVRLDQIQDLGGVRIIVSSIDAANNTIDCFRRDSKHVLHSESSYIAIPKRGGYRSHHMIFKFKGIDVEEVFNGRKVELQIRTRLQHTWATAVEAVGTFRRENLKAGKGDSNWLRLFELMSAEFAIAEDCEPAANLPPRNDRIKEMRELAGYLDAQRTLEALRQVVRYTASYVQAGEKPEFFRIELNRNTGEVFVKPHSMPKTGLQEQHSVEQLAVISGNRDINTVFVSAASIDELKQGYPNYFGDVQLFNKNLRDLVEGRHVKEYTMPPQIAVPAPPHEAPDLTWFRAPRRWK